MDSVGTRVVVVVVVAAGGDGERLRFSAFFLAGAIGCNNWTLCVFYLFKLEGVIMQFENVSCTVMFVLL